MVSARIWIFYQVPISQISVNAEMNPAISQYNVSLDPSSDLIERVPHALEGILKQQRSLYRARAGLPQVQRSVADRGRQGVDPAPFSPHH